MEKRHQNFPLESDILRLSLPLQQQLEERDDQLSALQAELSEATHTITTLTSQLEAAAGVGARRSGTAAAQGGGVFAELDALRVRLRESERETASEVQRREQVSTAGGAPGNNVRMV